MYCTLSSFSRQKVSGSRLSLNAFEYTPAVSESP